MLSCQAERPFWLSRGRLYQEPFFCKIGVSQENLSSRLGLAIADGDILAVVQCNRRCPRLTGGFLALEVVDHQIFKMFHFNPVRQIVSRGSDPLQIEALNGKAIDIAAE